MAAVPDADDLYGLPLEEFVPARTELARRLRKEGRREDAAAVGGLRKPSLPAWAVNQVARRRPEERDALLAAADRLRRDPGAQDELRRTLDSLVRAAGELLEEAGHRASDATLQKVGTTLRAGAASTGDEREQLARGTLERELEPSGFEAMAGLAGSAEAAPAPARKPRERPPARREERPQPRRDDRAAARREEREEARRRRVEEAEEKLAEARDRARVLGREAKEAEAAAERARREAERAEAGVERAERALERARGRR